MAIRCGGKKRFLVRALNLTVPLGSDDLGYRSGSGSVQTSNSILFCTSYFIVHLILPYFFSPICMYVCILSCVVLHILHCPLNGPDLIYISLLIIFCIIEYVKNKTLNPWISDVLQCDFSLNGHVEFHAIFTSLKCDRRHNSALEEAGRLKSQCQTI